MPRNSPFQNVTQRRVLHAIAAFEALKGLAALAAVIGVVGLLHQDVHHLAEVLLWRFHLKPDSRYPELLLHYANLFSTINLRVMTPVALAYIMVRWLEAYGLWKDRVWAEWLGALSGALYVPLEIAHLLHGATLPTAAVLAANVLMVAFLTWRLWRRRTAPKDASPAP